MKVQLVAVACLLTCTTSKADWTPLLAAPDTIERTAEFLGIVESLKGKVDRLMEIDFKSGCDFLDQARRSKNLEESKFLFREARSAFTRAANLAAGSQEGSRLLSQGLSRVGIWHCSLALEDEENAQLALEQILQISTDPSLWTKIKAVIPPADASYFLKHGELPPDLAQYLTTTVLQEMLENPKATKVDIQTLIENACKERAFSQVDPDRDKFLKLRAWAWRKQKRL